MKNVVFFSFFLVKEFFRSLCEGGHELNSNNSLGWTGKLLLKGPNEAKAKVVCSTSCVSLSVRLAV